MREILDRLKEAMAALDQELHDTYFSVGMGDQRRAIGLFWKAKQNVWFAQMQVLDAFQGEIPDPCI